MSIAVAPESTKSLPTSNFKVSQPFKVIVGGVVSGCKRTLTTLFIVDLFPDLSLAVYLNVYSPIVDISTLPSTVTLISPFALSLVSTPGSLNFIPCCILNKLAPFKVIVGGVVSTTFTVLVLVTLFPLLSLAI